jgi:hypothetical protein
MPIQMFNAPAATAAGYQAMSCHCFALSGDPLAIAVTNERYAELGMYIRGDAPVPAGLQGVLGEVLAETEGDLRRATLRFLCNQFGMAPGNGTDIRVWGLFRNAQQMLPEHMWITMNGQIYDTMPDAPIRRQGDNEGRNPPSEAHALPADQVFSVEVAALYRAQTQVIGSANWANEG